MSQITICPRCQGHLSVPEGITDRTLLCPRCLGSVDNSFRGVTEDYGGINTDVRREMNVGGIVLAVLIGLCLLGVFAIAASPRPRGELTLVLQHTMFPLMYIFVALMVLFSIVWVRAIIRSARSKGGSISADRIAGVTCLSIIAVILTIAALAIVFVVTCNALVFR